MRTAAIKKMFRVLRKSGKRIKFNKKLSPDEALALFAKFIARG